MFIQIATSGPCSLWQSLDQYALRGPTGEHVLSREVTDLNRLQAHWAGFCQNNGCEGTSLNIIEAGDDLLVWSNQNYRDAVVLAVAGTEALVEYEMPNGTTAMNVYSVHNGKLVGQDGAPDWGTMPEGCHLPRSVSYRSCPKKWIRAMVEAGTSWMGNGQGSRSAIPFPG
jgi:hypothetical protein